MLKKLLFGLGLTLSCPAALLAQRNCGTMNHLDMLEQQMPGTKARLQQADRDLTKMQQVQGGNLKTNAIVTIPVVVHVVYRTTSQNISDAQIQSQIDVLNEDFSKTNVDAVNIPAAFKPLAGDMQIRFELAKRDPNGNATTGITRTQTSVSSFTLNDAMKYTSQGGKDGWNRNKYLNIWVCPIGGGILGYAQFPGSGSAATDGVVIGYNYFGRTGVVSAPFNKGRTATHEVGHWLGLYHIWGDDNGGCTNDDQVADTPLQKGENYNCPSFPVTSGYGGSCVAASPGAMFMNYMDYVDDACMNMFTVGQVTRATQILQNQRPGILTSDGAIPVNIKPLDAAIIRINAPLGKFCEPNVTPRTILKNQGGTALTSAKISYKIDNGPEQTFQWTGNLRTYEATEVTLPVSTAGLGSHTLTVSVAAPNNGTDGEPADNALNGSFTVLEQNTGLSVPYREGFEGQTFPPQGWDVVNPDGTITWEKTSKAAYEGTNSAYINNFGNETIGEEDELQMPSLNLSSVTEPKLSFQVSYTAKNFGAKADTLEVLGSSDCGATFKSIYKRSGRDLATTTNTSANAFFPDNSQWRGDTITLEDFAGKQNVILKFRSVTGFENNLFIDDVNVTGKAIPKPGNFPFVVFPNPTSGRLKIQTLNKNNGEATVILLNSIGQKIMNQTMTPVDGIINLNFTGKADGIYFLHIISEGRTYKRKLVLDQIKGQ